VIQHTPRDLLFRLAAAACFFASVYHLTAMTVPAFAAIT